MRSATIFLLSAVLAAPAASFAATTTGQDRDDHRDEHHDKRYYDRDHRDYHDWNDHEARLFHEYVEVHHLHARSYAQLSAKQQRNYWKWRHDQDHDRR